MSSLGNSNANDRSTAHFAAVDQISNAENKIWLCSRNHRTIRNNGSDKLKHFHEDLSPRLSLLLTHRHTANGHVSIDRYPYLWFVANLYPESMYLVSVDKKPDHHGTENRLVCCQLALILFACNKCFSLQCLIEGLFNITLHLFQNFKINCKTK